MAYSSLFLHPKHWLLRNWTLMWLMNREVAPVRIPSLITDRWSNISVLSQDVACQLQNEMQMTNGQSSPHMKSIEICCQECHLHDLLGKVKGINIFSWCMWDTLRDLDPCKDRGSSSTPPPLLKIDFALFSMPDIHFQKSLCFFQSAVRLQILVLWNRFLVSKIEVEAHNLSFPDSWYNGLDPKWLHRVFPWMKKSP